MKSIIELAKQAGFGIDKAPIDQPYVIQPLHGKIDDELTRFAQLVRAEVLEEAAAIVEQAAMAYADPVWAQEIITDIRDRKEQA
jgi:hypothetical protein